MKKKLLHGLYPSGPPKVDVEIHRQTNKDNSERPVLTEGTHLVPREHDGRNKNRGGGNIFVLGIGSRGES